jgi:hypothetical protein
LLARQIFVRYDIPWFVEGKYMLSALRTPEIMPSDRDVDFVIPARDILWLAKSSDMAQILADYHLRVFIDDEYRDGRLCLARDHPAVDDIHRGKPGPRPDVYIDMTPIGYSDETKMLKMQDFTCPLRPCDPDVFPLRTLVLNGEPIQVGRFGMRVRARVRAFAHFPPGRQPRARLRGVRIRLELVRRRMGYRDVRVWIQRRVQRERPDTRARGCAVMA